MNLLQVTKANKSFGTRVLFQDAQFSLNDGEHVGVIGPNGAGKTTLFKILVGQEPFDSGNVVKASGLRMAYLEQESDWDIDQTGEDFLIKSCIKPIWELKQLGLELGLTEEILTRPLRSLSGGFRMRVKLLSLIGTEPHVMLLDEPTNFLDLESLIALEKFLQNYSGAFLVISHDREFLKKITEFTLEVEAGEITKFPGHIDDYFEQKTLLQEELAARAANLETKRKHMQDFVDRFRAKATKAKQAQSRMRQLEKLEKIEIKKLPVRSQISIPPPAHTGKEILSIEGASLGYESKTVLSNVQMRLARGEHLGVVGRNGAGKSTLLKSLAGQIPLLAGKRTLGYQVQLAIYSQHSTDQLSPEKSVLESLQEGAHPACLAQEILNMAGSLLFSGEDVYKKIRVLSGGEKSRVALGQVLLKKAPLLLLDEPTNHLDFETVEALTESLRQYEGTAILVSHDRGFIGRVATQILEIKLGRLEVFPGTYEEYVWSLERNSWGSPTENPGKTEMPQGAPPTLERSESTGVKFNYRNQVKELTAQLKELQRKILKTEEILKALSDKRDQLLQSLINQQGSQAEQFAKDLASVSAEIEKTEETLLSHMEKLDAIENELRTLQNS